VQSLDGFQMLPDLVRSGQFVREYRDHRLEWMLRSGGMDIVREGMQRRNIRFSHELK
jgi:glutathione S-transferase/RNA polymerase-associated protein